MDTSSEEIVPREEIKFPGPPPKKPFWAQQGPGRGKGPKRRLPKLLKDMRAVYGQAKTYDRGEGQKNCRAMLEANPTTFMSNLAKMEAAYEAAKPKRTPEEMRAREAKVEGAELRVRELIEGLLDEWEGKK